jgi:RimJ/RimL family protein N-acetyltransferase
MESGYQTGPYILHTQRLLLRPPEMSDVPAMHHLANDPEIAANLSDLPHPYPREAAAAVVSAMQALSAQGEAYAFAVVPQSESLVGVVYLILDSANQRAELIYWIGQAFWGRGYATEAVQAVIAFAFNTLKLRRVHASAFAHNAASVRVMQKCGLQYEGTLRQHLLKNGQFVDLLCYGILRDEFKSAPA